MKLKFNPQIFKNGLWHNNQAFVALLGLCPLLAVSNTVINSLGLGLATTFTLIASNTIISTLRHFIPSEIRLPVFVLIIACVVTIVELLMKAWFYELYKILGIFIPLIVTNCVILARAETVASKNPPDKAWQDGLAVGLGFTLALLLLGGMRELMGTGILFAHADFMFGEMAKNWQITLIKDYSGLLLAILPPGAFIGLGLLIALKNVLDDKFQPKSQIPLNNDCVD
jgi:Na+-translocating ferredoxin:NAD+ oxidoreductase subunit E